MIVLSPFANGTANRAVGTVKALLENETDLIATKDMLISGTGHYKLSVGSLELLFAAGPIKLIGHGKHSR